MEPKGVDTHTVQLSTEQLNRLVVYFNRQYARETNLAHKYASKCEETNLLLQALERQ